MIKLLLFLTLFGPRFHPHRFSASIRRIRNIQLLNKEKNRRSYDVCTIVYDCCFRYNFPVNVGKSDYLY